MALIGCGFIGALMVAQPTGAGISVYALLALANAVLCAVRDLVGRRVRPEVPGMVVALSAAVVVLVGAAVAHLLLEDWVTPGAPAPPAARRRRPLPDLRPLLHLHGLPRRTDPHASRRSTIPSPLWAVISGLVVFGHLPNPLAIAGILLVVASGLAVVLFDDRRRRPAPAA